MIANLRIMNIWYILVEKMDITSRGDAKVNLKSEIGRFHMQIFVT